MGQNFEIFSINSSKPKIDIPFGKFLNLASFTSQLQLITEDKLLDQIQFRKLQVGYLSFLLLYNPSFF